MNKKVIHIILLLTFLLIACNKVNVKGIAEETSSHMIAGDESAFMGIWFPETGETAPQGFPDDFRLCKDGTGVVEGMDISWKFDEKRFGFTLTRDRRVFEYEYSISDSTLTFTNDNGKREKYIKIYDGSDPHWPDDPNWQDDVSENLLIYNDPDNMLRLFSMFGEGSVYDIKSQLEMAQIHEMLGNFGFSVKYYKRAANLGDSGAQNKLGEMYRDGTGVHKDENKAIDWFTKAASQGNVDAQKNLGL